MIFHYYNIGCVLYLTNANIHKFADADESSTTITITTKTEKSHHRSSTTLASANRGNDGEVGKEFLEVFQDIDIMFIDSLR